MVTVVTGYCVFVKVVVGAVTVVTDQPPLASDPDTPTRMDSATIPSRAAVTVLSSECDNRFLTSLGDLSADHDKNTGGFKGVESRLFA